MSMGDLESRVRRLEELVRFSPRSVEEKIIATAQAIRLERSSPRAEGEGVCNGLICITVHGCYNPEGGFALQLYKGGVDGESLADIVTTGPADCFSITEAGLYTAVITKDGYSDSPRTVEIEADCGRTDVSVTMTLDSDYECLPCCTSPTPKTFNPTITDRYGTWNFVRSSGLALDICNTAGLTSIWTACHISSHPESGTPNPFFPFNCIETAQDCYFRYCLACLGNNSWTITKIAAKFSCSGSDRLGGFFPAGTIDCTSSLTAVGGQIYSQTINFDVDPDDCSLFDYDVPFTAGPPGWADTVTISGTP